MQRIPHTHLFPKKNSIVTVIPVFWYLTLGPTSASINDNLFTELIAFSI